MTVPTTDIDTPPCGARRRPRADRRGLRAGRSRPRRRHACRGLEDGRREPPARRRRGRDPHARREPRPGGRVQGRAGRRRDVAPDRSAPIEQGPPRARGVRRHPVRRLRRRWPSGWTASPAMSEAPARPRATRSCSRSTSTTTRRRPASRPAELDDAVERTSGLDALDVRGLMTIGRLVADAEAARPTFAALRDAVRAPAGEPARPRARTCRWA